MQTCALSNTFNHVVCVIFAEKSVINVLKSSATAWSHTV